MKKILFLTFILLDIADISVKAMQFNGIPVASQNQGKKQQRHRVKFTPQEDEELRLLVHAYGTEDWREISKQMSTRRNPRQCRDRWNFYLKPGVGDKKWTLEEDRLLIQKVAENGRKWKRLSPFFPGKSASELANHYDHALRRGLFFPNSQSIRQKDIQKEVIVPKKQSESATEVASKTVAHQKEGPAIVSEFDDDFGTLGLGGYEISDTSPDLFPLSAEEAMIYFQLFDARYKQRKNTVP